MKKLLILLFIPLFGASQDYNDIMSINSEDSFKRVLIENGYEFDEIDEEGWLFYGHNITPGTTVNGITTLAKSQKWGIYNTNDGRFSFQLYRQEDLFGDTSKTPYDLIVKDIKKNCEYYKILNYKGTDYVSYSCPESTYKGKIGFVVLGKIGIIRHFPNTN